MSEIWQNNILFVSTIILNATMVIKAKYMSHLSKMFRVALVVKNSPTPPKIRATHGGLSDFGSELTKNTLSQIGPPHEGLRDFLVLSLPKLSSPKLELLMQDLVNLVLS